MKVLNSDSMKVLESYINGCSPVGEEEDGQKIWLDGISPYSEEMFQDLYGNSAAIINPEEKYRVAITAHSDVVSWMVSQITKKGFLYVVQNGGADPLTAPGKAVIIHTQKQNVPGIFGWPAVHIRKDKVLNPDKTNLFIDCGCESKQEAEDLGIRVGDIVTYISKFRMLNDKFVRGQGLDNRIGGFIIMEAMRLLKEHKKRLPYCLMAINTVQEEIGKAGMMMVSERLKPDLAIVTDMAHDTNTPYINKRIHGDFKCGRGPIIGVAPQVHKGLLNIILKTADKHDIPYQIRALSKHTGTDADAIAVSGKGVCAALVSIPLRYMHTPSEIVHIKDVENAVLLLYHTLKNLDVKEFEG